MSDYLDSNRWDDPAPGPSEQDERDHVADILKRQRARLREVPCDGIAKALLLEWQRKARLLQCFRRADRAWQGGGRTPIHHGHDHGGCVMECPTCYGEGHYSVTARNIDGYEEIRCEPCQGTGQIEPRDNNDSEAA